VKICTFTVDGDAKVRTTSTGWVPLAGLGYNPGDVPPEADAVEVTLKFGVMDSPSVLVGGTGVWVTVGENVNVRVEVGCSGVGVHVFVEVGVFVAVALGVKV
jgi:hypothetical protein